MHIVFSKHWLGVVLFIGMAASASPIDRLSKTEPVCFGHKYSAQELESRPAQTVHQLKIKFYLDEYATLENPLLKVAALIRKNTGKVAKYANDLACTTSENQIQCDVECDGGSLTVTWEKETSDQGIRMINKGFVLYGGCGEDESDPIFLNPTPNGDDLFDLEVTKC